jgi:hypothetical protein
MAVQPQRCDVRQLLRDVGAGAVPRLDIAFAHQLFERQQHRIAGHAEFLGQHAARGKARTRPQAAGQDQLHELAIDLVMERFAAFAFDVDRHRRGTGRAAAHGRPP